MSSLSELRTQIRANTHADEATRVEALLAESRLTDSQRDHVVKIGRELVQGCRGDSDKAGTLDVFMQEFSLSSKEGVALMCLAESLLRVPDAETADDLIAEKILSGDWGEHSGKSDSLFVNASTW
ncbi:MAG: bifunctional proline dehydrogenase/L-glutamate gamma-semialdehyde dehydrogenase, partial [Porticoccaceae bacterium]|nr:bifunctional proline dehydrogenase/L-glutamate gamma-semialdehyde dehydrogenase [Porticoccaceae bacterium]